MKIEPVKTGITPTVGCDMRTLMCSKFLLMNSSTYSSCIFHMACFSPTEEKPIWMNLSYGRLTSAQVYGHNR